MAEKKKILYIVEAMGGGVFTYIVDLANELVNKYDMYIAYAVRKQTPKNYKDYFDKRIHLIEVKNFGRAINPTKDIAAFFEVKKIAAGVKPDVIHLHSSKAGAIGRVAFDGKIPMFYTPHGYSFLMENCNPTKRRVFKLIESVCAKRNCTTISCSVGEHQETLKLTKNAAYVNNGINMKELQEIVNQTEKVAHPFTVFTLGRICYQKNPTLFNTIAELLPDVRFVWIGDGELREELKSKNIEISGWVDRTTAIKYAVNADVFLLPSRWEGLPISLLGAISYFATKVIDEFNPITFLLGHGEDAAANVMLETSIVFKNFSTTDNQYLLIFYNYGLIALIVILSGAVKCIVRFIRTYRSNGNTVNCLLFICISQAICSFFYELTENKSCAFLVMCSIGMLLSINVERADKKCEESVCE